MILNETGTYCEGYSGECHSHYSSSESPKTSGRTKPIEVYAFIDPMCPICWAMEPIIKKLVIEYGQYFKLRFLIGGRLNTLNNCEKKKHEQKAVQERIEKWEKISRNYGMPCDGSVWMENSIDSSYNTAIAVKAAELQGKQAGLRFLREIREAFFLNKQNISHESVLLSCARRTGLDVEEFKKDFHANGALKAYKCDMKITKEMEVDHLPTLVFLNANEETGIKVSGNYPYRAFEQVIFEMLENQPKAEEPPEIENFLKKYPFVATKEIAVVYDLSCEEADRKMKKLQLQQLVEKVPVKNGTFWRYVSRT